MSKPLNEVAIIKIFVDYYYILKNSSLFQIDAFHNKVSVIDIINFCFAKTLYLYQHVFFSIMRKTFKKAVYKTTSYTRIYS
jgi:hypothetical protein